jgi:hypothetical protein
MEFLLWSLHTCLQALQHELLVHPQLLGVFSVLQSSFVRRAIVHPQPRVLVVLLLVVGPICGTRAILDVGHCDVIGGIRVGWDPQPPTGKHQGGGMIVGHRLHIDVCNLAVCHVATPQLPRPAHCDPAGTKLQAHPNREVDPPRQPHCQRQLD